MQLKNVMRGMVVLLVILLSCKEQKKEDRGDSPVARIALNQTEENIYRSSDSMLAAFRRKDWMTFVKYNHPNMTKMMGGSAAFASFIKMQMKQIPDSVMKSITINKILQVVKTPQDEQCVVEQNMLLNLNGDSLYKKTYLVGESLDKGNTWTFFDATTKTSLAIKDIKPDISNELKIPSVKKEIQ